MQAHRTRPTARDLARSAGTPRGFTLMEIIVAVGAVALIAVGLASIFDTVGKTVTGGKRVSNLNTYASLLERQMRADFAAMSRGGFMAIRQQWVDVDGDGLYDPTVDLVRVSSNDTAPRGRRIDEMIFFVDGRFTSAREALVPGVQASAGNAMVYYGHGQAGPWFDPQDHQADTTGYRKQPTSRQGQVGTPSLGGVVDRNAFGAAMLGPGGPAGAARTADTDPNFYAGDWTLLRRPILLSKPGSADALPEGLPRDPATGAYQRLFGGRYDPSRVGPEHIRFLDKNTQIALQPAASSIFRSIQTYYPAITNPESTFRSRADSAFLPPFIASGTVDIATTDLNEIRAIVTTGGTTAGIVVPSNLTASSPPAWLPLLSLLGFPATSVEQNGQFPTRPTPLTVDVDRVHAWMQDAFPAESRNVAAMQTAQDIPLDYADQTANGGQPGTRMRYEPLTTDLLAAMTTRPDGSALPSPLGGDDQMRLAEYRADQMMLTRSALVPHCSEFIIEWSFGNQDQNGNVVWHGPKRRADTNGDGVVNASDSYVVRPYPYDAQNRVSGKYTLAGNWVDTTPGTNRLPQARYHTTTDRLIYGFSPNHDDLTPGEACLTSYFGWTDPTYAEGAALVNSVSGGLCGPDGAPATNPPSVNNANGPNWVFQGKPTLAWAWPRLIRVTVTLSDPQEPTIESTFQFIFSTPADPK